MKLLVFLILSASAFADPAPKHTCRILFLNGPDSAPEKLQLFDGSKCTEVELPRMNFSKVYELAGGPLTLSMLSAPPVDPKNIPAGAPGVVVAETMADFYLLLSSDPANQIAPVRLQVIDASAEKLKLGQMLWFNLSPDQVGGVLGSEKISLQPGGRATVNAPAAGAQDYVVNLAFRIPGNELLYPLCETKWRHDPRSRSVAFIMTETGVRSPRVMVFPDYREPVEKR